MDVLTLPAVSYRAVAWRRGERCCSPGASHSARCGRCDSCISRGPAGLPRLRRSPSPIPSSTVAHSARAGTRVARGDRAHRRCGRAAPRTRARRRGARRVGRRRSRRCARVLAWSVGVPSVEQTTVTRGPRSGGARPGARRGGGVGDERSETVWTDRLARSWRRRRRGIASHDAGAFPRTRAAHVGPAHRARRCRGRTPSERGRGGWRPRLARARDPTQPTRPAWS